MECQKILESLSSFIDGELDASEVAYVKSHMEYCSACREQWQLLLDVTSLLHSLPEVIPHPEFHSNLRSELTKMTSVAIPGSVLPDLNAEQYNDINDYQQNNDLESLGKDRFIPFTDQQSEENNYIKNLPTKKLSLAVSFWRNLTGGMRFKLTACAVLLMLTFGITALWYARDLDLKNGSSAHIYSMSDNNSPRNNIPKYGDTVQDNHIGSNFDGVNGADKKENEAKTNKIQIEASTAKTEKKALTAKTQVDAVEEPLKVPTGQNSRELLPDNSQENHNIDEGINTSKNVASDEARLSTGMNDSTAGQSRDLAAAPSLPLSQDDQQIFSNNLSAKDSVSTNNGSLEAASKKISTEKPRSRVIQMNVENDINTTAQILILSKNKSATVKVENNKIYITVPAENYNDLVKQIDSLDEVSNPKAMPGGTAQTQESKSLLIQVDEQKAEN